MKTFDSSSEQVNQTQLNNAPSISNGFYWNLVSVNIDTFNVDSLHLNKIEKFWNGLEKQVWVCLAKIHRNTVWCHTVSVWRFKWHILLANLRMLLASTAGSYIPSHHVRVGTFPNLQSIQYSYISSQHLCLRAYEHFPIPSQHIDTFLFLHCIYE